VAGATGKVVYTRQTAGAGNVVLAGTDAAYFNQAGVLVAGSALVAAVAIDLTACGTVDIIGLIKPGVLAAAPFDALRSVACPLLYPEKLSYKFQVQQNSTLDISLRGDSIFYAPGTSYNQHAVGGSADIGGIPHLSGGTYNTLVLTYPAGLYTSAAGDSRVLSVSVDGQRQIEGTDFTVSAAPGAYSAATITFVNIPTTAAKVSVVYFSSTIANFPQSVHPLASAKPAAVKGRDVRVYIGATYDPANPTASAAYRWSGVQSVTADWAVNVTKDYELGSALATTVEADDVPTVNGSVSLRARNAAELFTRLRQITGVTSADKAVGPDNAVELTLDIVVLDSTGAVMKRLHVPDARFSLPGYNAQVGQRVDVDMSYTSDTGSLLVYSA
jgi:hypothetical protein